MTAPQEQEPVTLGVVRMVFEEESWVEIRDRSGNTVFAQLSPAGSRRRASGEPPLSVVVGNAAGVQLSYNDRQIDLVPHTRVDVARLTLE
jgi:cytoskeleton protein RodZ